MSATWTTVGPRREAEESRTVTSSKIWRVAIVGFSHMHVGDQIRATLEHPDAELVGVWDPDESLVTPLLGEFGISADLVFDNVTHLMSGSAPDIVIVCSTTADHLALVEELGPYGVHILLEKPFALSLADADRMIAAVSEAGSLSVNWPLAWYPSHRTTQRLIAEGRIGKVREIHYYDGNRGPLHHVHDKREVAGPEVVEAKNASWWYSPENGGGSLLDYLGYGATLGTWFRNGEMPLAVLAKTYAPPGLHVDEQSVVIGVYEDGLSTFQTRWGTFSDPWDVQPYPRCGFVVVGTDGTVLSEDFAPSVMIQTRQNSQPQAVAVDETTLPFSGGLAYLIHRAGLGLQPEGPSSWELSRAGQAIVDAAAASAREGTEVAIREAELTR